jgi:hypothetical protein
MEFWQATPPLYVAFLNVSKWGRKNYLLSLEKPVKIVPVILLMRMTGFLLFNNERISMVKFIDSKTLKPIFSDPPCTELKA